MKALFKAIFGDIFKCKHEWKTVVPGLEIAERGRISGTDVVITTGEFRVFRCYDCRCLVWEHKRYKKEE